MNKCILVVSIPASNEFRYRAVQLRARFDENRCKDLGEGTQILACAQKELFETKHFQPRNCKQMAAGHRIYVSNMLSLQLPTAPVAAPSNER